MNPGSSELALSGKAEAYLRTLCEEISSRRVGSPGNKAATDLFAQVVGSFGFATESPEFDCVDWTSEGARLAVDGVPFAVQASPYSLGCDVSAPLAVVSTLEELESVEVSDRVLLLRGGIAREPLMPKSFPFYNPDEHRRIVQLLETKRPLAIVTAAARNPEMIGAAYPYPLVEDGDFDLPSVYTTEEEGARLAEHAGRSAALESRSARVPSQGRNVVARKGETGRRVVLFAHVDSRIGSPGATDNATGVVVLLLLAELLADYAGRVGVELVAMNGEDYYSNPGEQLYLAANAGRFDEIALGVNVDGVGYREGRVAYSSYGCPPDLEGWVREALAAYPSLVEGEPWYQGDHGLFLMNQRPALAMTSERQRELMAEIVHSPRDRPEIVDVARLVDVARALHDLLSSLDRRLRGPSAPLRP